MSQLPPWVIKHGTKDFGPGDDGKPRPIFLSATGWSPNRKDALSFEAREQAIEWIKTATANTPQMFKGVHARVESLPFEPEKHEPLGTIGRASPHDPTLNDYDPYEGA